MPIKSLVRTIPNHPKPGIMFRDITTLLKDPVGFRITIQELVNRYLDWGIHKVVGIESRGFILGAPLAYAIGAGFVPIRKPGKLPAATIGHDYELEYGSDRLEIHTDAITPGERVLLVDDLIATGGTALAAVELIDQLGGDPIECAFAISLPDLGGVKSLQARGLDCHVLAEFEGD
jgi:adenine phosphoribosyltransferase